MEALCVSIAEAGAALGIGRSKIYQLVQAGQIETIQIGTRRLVPVASIHKFVSELERVNP